MKRKPFFSIILPTFNSYDYLRNAIISIVNQTFIEWELIIIDNYSSDNTVKLIKSFNDSRIKFYKIRNKGIHAKSRNLGIKKALAEWVCFIDSDDTWYSNKLEITKHHIDKYNSDLFYHSLNFINKNFLFLKKPIADKNKKIVKPIFKEFVKNGNGIGQSSVVVKKKVLKKIGYISEQKDKFAWEDFDTWVRISLISNKFKHIPIILGSISVGEKNISNLNQDIVNNNNFTKYYREKAKNKFNIDLNKAWWIKYPYLLKKFRDKKFLDCYEILNSIPESPIKFKLRFFYIKYFSLFRILIANFKKKINFIILFIFIESNNKFNNSNFKLIIINKKNKFDLLCKKNENFDINKSYRFKNYEKLYLLKFNSKIVSYGWQKSCENFHISEIKRSFSINRKGYILYDFFTFKEYRNRGYYQKLLYLISQRNKKRDIFIYTTILNLKSMRSIFKSGFKVEKFLNIFSKKIIKLN